MFAMDNGKHHTKPLDAWASLLPQEGADSYPRLVASDRNDMRRIRVDQELWDAFAELVGDGGRAAAIRNYIQWQLANPNTPLPGQFRPPAKKVRKRRPDPE